MNSRYVQYGAAACAPHSWENFDISPSLRLQRIPAIGKWFQRRAVLVFPENVQYGDIIRGLPIPDKSCAGVYCSHVLEHLALVDFRTALGNTLRLLRQGGRFRFVLPDLELLASKYLSATTSRAAVEFMEGTRLGLERRPRGVNGLLRSYFGNTAHLWMWDFKSIREELEEVGFKQIRRAEFGDSQDPRFKDVEEIGRWTDCLGVECFK